MFFPAGLAEGELMRILHFEAAGVAAIAADDGSGWRGLAQGEGGFPGTLPELVAQGADLLRAGRNLLSAPPVDLSSVRILPPIPSPPKILCVGLNYRDHVQESGLGGPTYPEIFARFSTSLIPHLAPIRRPRESSTLDYEAELAVVIGRGGRRIVHERALEHVAGYSLFNDATIREFQLRTPEWPRHAGGAHRPAYLQRRHADRDDQHRDASAARRRDHHGHARRRRRGAPAAGLHAARRHLRRGDRGDRRPQQPRPGRLSKRRTDHAIF